MNLSTCRRERERVGRQFERAHVCLVDSLLRMRRTERVNSSATSLRSLRCIVTKSKGTGGPLTHPPSGCSPLEPPSWCAKQVREALHAQGLLADAAAAPEEANVKVGGTPVKQTPGMKRAYETCVPNVKRVECCVSIRTRVGVPCVEGRAFEEDVADALRARAGALGDAIEDTSTTRAAGSLAKVGGDGLARKDLVSQQRRVTVTTLAFA